MQKKKINKTKLSKTKDKKINTIKPPKSGHRILALQNKTS